MLTEEKKNENTAELEASAFGRVLARLMRDRGMTVDTETVEWLADGSGLVPEDLMARMANETREHVGDLSGLRDALKLNDGEAKSLALAYALEIEEREEEAPRCRMASRVNKPCWRDAAFPWSAGETEPTLCAEHARLVELNDDLAGWYRNLETIDAWIKGPVAEVGDDDLTTLAYNVRDEARREYATLAIRVRAAEMVADRGPLEPGEVPAFLEQEEELAAALAREAALTNARTILEDADEDDARITDRWATVDALADAADAAHAEVGRLRGELGVTE